MNISMRKYFQVNMRYEKVFQNNDISSEEKIDMFELPFHREQNVAKKHHLHS